MPLCAGEIITSLDVVKKDQKGNFQGAPTIIVGKNIFLVVN